MVTGPLKDANKKKLGGIFQTFKVPGFVKQANLDECMQKSAESCAGLDDYPIGSKASAWVSAAYFLSGDKEAMDEASKRRVESNLRKAAEAYNIDYEELEKEAEASKYEEEADIPYALTVNGEGVCPIPTEDSLNKAAEWVYENRSDLSFDQRKQTARSILKRAHDLSVDDITNESYVEKAAGIGLGDPEKAADKIRSRGALFDDKNIIDTLNKAADRLEQNDVFTPSEHEKVAELVAAADEAGDVSRLYKRNLKTPEELMYEYSSSDIQKEAGDLIDLANGMTISEMQLKRADFNTVAGVLGEDFADKCNPLNSLFPEMDLMKEAVQELGEEEADDLVSILPDDRFMRSLPKI